VDKHERSRNHKTALDEPEKIKAATQRLAKQTQKTVSAEGGEQYRDRAKERREAFNQPNRPALINPNPKTQVEATTMTMTMTTSTTKANTATATPKSESKSESKSKGSAMLAKMGWTAGTGLGADNAGRTSIIETKAYQAGVGLGADGGDLGDAAALGERRTQNSYADFVSTVQDKARARYEQLQDAGK